MKIQGQSFGRAFLAPWAAALMLVATFAASAYGEKVKFSLDWIAYAKHARFFVALDKGHYRKAGLEVTIERGYGSPNTTAKVGSKAVDFGYADPSSNLLGRAQGMKVVNVALIHGRGLQCVLALKSSGIKTAKDLRGRRLGVTFGDALHSTFQAFADANGIKTWEYVGMRPAAKNPSLLAKKVDAILTYRSVAPALLVGARKQGDEIVALLYGDYGVNLPSDGITVRDDYLKANPDLVRRFVKATLQGWAWGIPRSRHEAAVDIFRKSYPTSSKKLGMAQWGVSVEHTVTKSALDKGLGYIPPEQMDYTYRIITKAFKKIFEKGTPVKMTDVYTNDYLPRPPIMIKQP